MIFLQKFHAARFYSFFIEKGFHEANSMHFLDKFPVCTKQVGKFRNRVQSIQFLWCNLHILGHPCSFLDIFEVKFWGLRLASLPKPVESNIQVCWPECSFQCENLQDAGLLQGKVQILVYSNKQGPHQHILVFRILVLVIYQYIVISIFIWN